MTKEDQILERAAEALLVFLQAGGQILDKYLERLNIQPAVQLFGVSQAGKSTLISCLTSGEQWIPIGTGTATTAVKVELLSVGSFEQPRAEIKWLPKEELLGLVKQAPMDVFIQAMERDPSPSVRKILTALNHSTENERELTLDSKEHRGFLWEVLEEAKREREEEDIGEVGQHDSLAVTEVILRHYEEYLREFTPEGITIEGEQNLPEISRWTRQPHDWLKRSISDYSFDELRSFFTKEIRLYAPTQNAVNGLRILDTPGFGVNLLHSKICREAQREAKAVILVLGTQLTIPDLEEIKQLKTGMSNSQSGVRQGEENIRSRLSDNIFIVWNQKGETKENAEDNLEKMLERLQREANITISPDRVAVVNLRLALRALQWEKIQSGGGLSPSTFESLYQIFLVSHPRRFENQEKDRKEVIKDLISRQIQLDKQVFSDSEDSSPNDLELSGWNKIVELLASIRDSQKQIQRMEFAASLLERVKNYLQTFSTPKDIKQKEAQAQCLDSILAEFKKKAGLIRTEMEIEIDLWDETILKDFLSYLTDSNELSNLRTRIKNLIDSELYFTNVPGKIKASLIDYVDARCSAWVRDFVNFDTSSSREHILGGYQKSVYDFKYWIFEKIRISEGSFEIMLPTAINPIGKLDAFDSSFKEWSDKIINDTFNIDWLDKIGIAFAAAGTEIGHQAERFGNQTKYALESAGAWFHNRFSKDKKTVTRRDTERKPNFNRIEAFTSAKDKINILLSQEEFLALYGQGKEDGLLTVQPQQRAISSLFDENLISGNLVVQQVISKAFSVYESVTQAMLMDKDEKLCRSFCLSWKQRKKQTLAAVNSSFTEWTTCTESVIEERRENLKKQNPLIEPENLKKIEEIVEQLKSLPSLNFQDPVTKLSEAYRNALDEVEHSIKDRKLN